MCLLTYILTFVEGSADIPIVRLNPLNILGVKREGEESLRETGVPYTIVRPWYSLSHLLTYSLSYLLMRSLIFSLIQWIE